MQAELDVRVEANRVVGCGALPHSSPESSRHSTTKGASLVLVGSAASLLEGDALRISLRLGPGVRLTVTSVAAILAHPCRAGGTTRLSVSTSLEKGPGWPG